MWTRPEAKLSRSSLLLWFHGHVGWLTTYPEKAHTIVGKTSRLNIVRTKIRSQSEKLWAKRRDVILFSLLHGPKLKDELTLAVKDFLLIPPKIISSKSHVQWYLTHHKILKLFRLDNIQTKVINDSCSFNNNYLTFNVLCKTCFHTFRTLNVGY